MPGHQQPPQMEEEKMGRTRTGLRRNILHKADDPEKVEYGETRLGLEQG